MQLFRTLDDVEIGFSSCAIGMFDGIHIGHRMVLEQAIRQAKIRNLTPVVFTFANHPQSIISQTPTPLLSTLEERIQAFEAFGYEAALILDFTPELKETPAQTFVQSILVDTLHVQAVSIGYDHRFGKNRKGDGPFLKEAGEKAGFSVDIIAPVKVGNQIVSSTLIRKLLSYGDLSRANQLLGRPYQLSGKVIKGDGRGKALGFPTANLSISPECLMPANGVYAGLVDSCPAVCNIGYAPTFDLDLPAPRMEVHILGSTDDLYDQTLTFTFLHYLRQEQTFESLPALVSQLEADCKQARELIS
jgi:riboflavin kinase/FMN adenylyltransferase